ncbi:MAG: hypothetical protein AAF050_10485 [Cyanobacteria bacterium J06649_5]
MRANNRETAEMLWIDESTVKNRVTLC